MKKTKWFVLMLAAGLIGIGILMTGCQQATETPTILQITSVSPALDAADISSTETLSITFNYPIKTVSMTKANFFTEYAEYISGSHDAGTPEVTNLQWSNQNRTMTLTVNGWSNLGKGSGNNRVAIRATNRIEDIFGDTLGTAAVLWRFRLRLRPKTTAPTLTPSAGSFEANSILITIEAADANAIYYTDDGTDPTPSSNLYTAPISLESSKVIKAIAVRSGYSNSDVAEAWYDLWWWQALGSGVDHDVYALAYDPDNNILYAAGIFDIVGGITVNNIAQWDGSQWSALDSGIIAELEGLLFHSGTLYVGGGFDPTPGNNIAKWESGSWSGVGNGVDDGVDSFAYDSSGSLLYAGGSFTREAGTSNQLNRVAKWDGSAWSALGSGVNDRIDTLAYDPDHSLLYAGGLFATAGGVSANYVAKWDGSTWEALDNGVSGGMPPGVKALTYRAGNLFVGGAFTTAGSITTNNIAQWNGTSWSALGSGTNDDVWALASDFSGNILYTGGNFTSPASRLARWDGSAWDTLGSGIDDGTVYALLVDPQGALYAGGNFTSASGVAASCIAKWGKK